MMSSTGTLRHEYLLIALGIQSYFKANSTLGPVLWQAEDLGGATWTQ